LYNVITSDMVTEAHVKNQIGSGEIYRFLSETIDLPPRLVVVIDEKTKELEEACNSIPLSEKHVIEFKIFERIDAGIKNAFLFEPITEKPPPPPPPPKGKITPQSAYAMPILESLVEMGGSGRVRDILEKVHEKMKDVLTPADLEKLSSGIMVRWKNHAMWMRQKLKTNGYLKSGSPSGIWEITEKGRAFLEMKK